MSFYYTLSVLSSTLLTRCSLYPSCFYCLWVSNFPNRLSALCALEISLSYVKLKELFFPYFLQNSIVVYIVFSASFCKNDISVTSNLFFICEDVQYLFAYVLEASFTIQMSVLISVSHIPSSVQIHSIYLNCCIFV